MSERSVLLFLIKVLICLISTLSKICLKWRLIDTNLVHIVIRVIVRRLLSIKVLQWLHIIVRLKRNGLIRGVALELVRVEALLLISELRLLILIIWLKIVLILKNLPLVSLLLLFILNLRIQWFRFLIVLLVNLWNFGFLLFRVNFILNKIMLHKVFVHMLCIDALLFILLVLLF